MTNPTGPATPSGWTVIGQRQTQELNGGQQFVKGVEITFRTGDGVTGNVFVPLTQFDPAHVTAAVSAQAAQLDAIGSLSAPPA